MHTATFTVDGYIGDTNVQGLVISDVISYSVDITNKVLQLNFASKAPVFIVVGTAATWTVTVTGGFVTAVVIAD